MVAVPLEVNVADEDIEKWAEVVELYIPALLHSSCFERAE
jgi:hypothetical protein